MILAKNWKEQKSIGHQKKRLDKLKIVQIENVIFNLHDFVKIRF